MSSMALTIGEFAQCVGLNPKTIRYYEEIGLLPRPPRNEVGYRLYYREDLARVRFIRRAKLLGLSLAEAKQLADYADDRECHSLQEQLLALVQEQLVEVDRRMAELAEMRDELHRCRAELTAWVEEGCAQQAAIAKDDVCQCLMEAKEEHGVN